MDINMTGDLRKLPKAEPDPQGQAALMLVESLIHGLIERGVIDVLAAIEIVQVAREVKFEIAEETGESREVLNQSIAAIDKMIVSLRSEL